MIANDCFASKGAKFVISMYFETCCMCFQAVPTHDRDDVVDANDETESSKPDVLS